MPETAAEFYRGPHGGHVLDIDKIKSLEIATPSKNALEARTREKGCFGWRGSRQGRNASLNAVSIGLQAIQKRGSWRLYFPECNLNSLFRAAIAVADYYLQG